MTIKKPSYSELEEKIREQEERIEGLPSHSCHDFEDRQFLRILLDTIPSPIFYKDGKGIYRHCNDAFARQILGIDREQVVNKSLFDLPEQIPVGLAKIYAEKDQELLDNPGTQAYRGEVKCADGNNRIFQFYKSTIMSESGEVAGLVGVMLDITSMVENNSQLEKKNSELESLSYIDALTGLYNRRKFETLFPEQLAQPVQADHILNVAIVDIDYFKLYNDYYGHPEGDRALKLVGNVISQTLKRPNDYAFRVGGEEFCLLFRSRDELGAMTLADTLRSRVHDLGIVHDHSDGTGVVTISIGLVSVRDDATDRSGLYEEADRLLYAAKNAGRNRVEHRVIEAVSV
ncbi:MAG TPA: sensor domain-containing diguanylate cyclase [Gammaproteobacteria bacterium]|nr:sensor domain-containing diguanylate cyclase [Gammaproteobacteria bacterium]